MKCSNSFQSVSITNLLSADEGLKNQDTYKQRHQRLFFLTVADQKDNIFFVTVIAKLCVGFEKLPYLLVYFGGHVELNNLKLSYANEHQRIKLTGRLKDLSFGLISH